MGVWERIQRRISRRDQGPVPGSVRGGERWVLGRVGAGPGEENMINLSGAQVGALVLGKGSRSSSE